MNPSYSSGPSNSGGQPGIVASGPDSSLPQGAEGAGNGRSGGFDFSGFINNIPKKWLAIGAGALVVILIIVVVAMGMGGKKSDSGNSGGSSPKPTPAFNKLINYVVSGEESESDLNGEYSALTSYYLVKQSKTKDEKTAVYNRTKELLENFTKNYKESDDASMNTVTKSIKEIFDLMYMLGTKDRIYDKDIQEKIKSEGKESAKKWVQSYYDTSSLGDNSYAEDFSTTYLTWAKAVFNNSADVNKLYYYLDGYYSMEGSFIQMAYNLNTLMHGKKIMESADA